MSKDTFSADDIASTFARFASKRRGIICDESKLQLKKPEPIELSSATRACGKTILSGIATILPVSCENSKSNPLEGVIGGERYQFGVKVDN
ncbi:hypothetical protein AW40_23240 [Kosakonia radicincitans UMEnt01/12]|uniref:hypothetical protein n=1 Tax=Kosakonia radicincitans TaxID=283686 RepID=UPI0004613F9A|nr:hypothetical protein [Kosakonia radicincitans]KDE34191.1 hypothetical protein AW40_23240 [Kosakonia radicincitans UMEnt01/12]